MVWSLFFFPSLRRGRKVFIGAGLAPFLRGFQAVAFPLGFDDVDAVGEPVEQRACETFIAQHLGPVLEGKVGVERHALSLIGAAAAAHIYAPASHGLRINSSI